MIKAKILNEMNGRTYFILGVTDIELERLRKGDPLGVYREAFNFKDGEPHCVVLVYGKTYDEVKERIERVEELEVGLAWPPKDAAAKRS